MKIHHMVCASLLASVALAPMAQTPPVQRDPQAANAAVPPLAYRSAFDGYMPSNDAAVSPDKVWRAANEKIGSAGGHGAHAHHPAPAMPGARHAHPGEVQHDAGNKPQKEGK